jgi:RNA polymerase sigma-70 factor (ECF subfamily)
MTDMTELAATPAPTLTRTELEQRLPAHRRELTGFCYRMLGCPHDAEDAVQETMVRAWRSIDGFAGRSSLRSWLFRIATNVCLDALKGRRSRALPMDLNAEASPPVESSLGTPEPAQAWVGPISDGAVLPASSDPAEVAVARESVRLAFVAALQHLPPRQRAVLVLRDVLGWRADEVAELLDSTVASANSALQRARATVAARQLDAPGPVEPPGPHLDQLLARYVSAFERYDMDELVALLREDATQSMPPFRLWISGARDIAAWMLGPGSGCRGSRLVQVQANGRPALAQYRPDPDGGHVPWGIHVLDLSGGKVVRITSFIDPTLFPRFGLADRL